jgi:preprotein translocase subunit YajC
MTAESLSSVRPQRKTVTQLERFLNTLEKLPTVNNLSGTPGKIFTIDESGLPVNNNPDTVITENGFIKCMF